MEETCKVHGTYIPAGENVVESCDCDPGYKGNNCETEEKETGNA